MQEELNDVAMLLVDIDEAIAAKQKTAKSGSTPVENEEPKEGAAVENDEVPATNLEDSKPAYVPAKGSENSVHLELSRTENLFDPKTGAKKEGSTYVQVFTYSEWQAFKNHFKGLGFHIMKVLHDPYDEAAQYVHES